MRISKKRSLTGVIWVGRPRVAMFTLLEVVVAVAILSLSMIAAMQLAASSSNRSVKAFEKWREEHMLAQATEYFLLVGPCSGAPPEEIFSYEGYSADCEEEPPDIPEDTPAVYGNWRIAKLHIRLLNDKGDELRSVSVHKILRN